MINSVRNTVLSILNKNNYGYISPSDFNLFAAQAQMELFEEYFGNYNKLINAENMRSSGIDYANVKKPIQETIESFLVSDFLVPRLLSGGEERNMFFLPSPTTVGNTFYMMNKVKVYTKFKLNGDSSAVAPFELIDAQEDFLNPIYNLSFSDIVVNATTFQSTEIVSIQNQTSIQLGDDIFQNVNDEYIIYSYKDYKEAEHVSNSKIDLLLQSNLTAPSLSYPAYSIIGDTMYLYPYNILPDPPGFTWLYGTVKVDYFRHPKTPKWTFTTLSGGEPVFNQSQPDYQDFEMPLEDEFKLVTKICQYCGVSIRETEVTQYAMAQEQQQTPL